MNPSREGVTDGFTPHFQPAAEGPQLDVARCFADAIAVYRRHFGTLVATSCMSIMMSVTTLSLFMGPLCGGWTLMCLDALSRRDGRLRTELVFSQGFRAAPLMALAFKATVAQLCGLALLFVPGVLITTNLLLSYPLMIDRGLSAAAAMDKSTKIVARRSYFPHLMLGAAVVVLNVLPALVPVIGWIVGCFTMPLGWLLIAAAYLQDVQEHSSDLGDIFPRGFEVPYATVVAPNSGH